VSALAAEFDAIIRQLKRRMGEIGDRRIAVMAGLTVLDRLKEAEERIADMQHRIQKLERAREEAALAAETEDEPLIARLEAATAVVERLTRTLVDETHALSEEDGAAAFSHARGAGETASALPAAEDEPAAVGDGGPAGDRDGEDDYPEFMQRT